MDKTQFLLCFQNVIKYQTLFKSRQPLENRTMENEERDVSSAPTENESDSQQRLQNLSEDEMQQIESKIIKRIAEQCVPDNRRAELMHERNASVVSTRTRGKRSDAHERSGRTDSQGISILCTIKTRTIKTRLTKTRAILIATILTATTLSAIKTAN